MRGRLLLLSLIVSACVTGSGIQSQPLNAGTQHQYRAQLPEVLQAARESIVEVGLTIETSEELYEEGWMIIAKEDRPAFSSGERVRVVVEAQGAMTSVWILTKKRVGNQVSARGDQSEAIFAGIAHRLG